MSKLREAMNQAAEQLKERLSLKTIGYEAYAHVADRVIPQGAAELAHAMHTGHAYLPYGPGQRPPHRGAGLHGTEHEQGKEQQGGVHGQGKDAEPQGSQAGLPHKGKEHDGPEMEM